LSDNVSDGTTHIFICYSSKDEAVARGIVQFLEARDIRCWISLRDVPPGQGYQETIVHALERARGIVFLFSEFSGKSPEIMKELSLAGGLQVPVFPLRLAPIAPSGALRYELATRQWIDIFDDPETGLDRLEQSIKNVLQSFAPAPAAADYASRPAAEPVQFAPAPAPAPAPRAPAAKRRARATREPIVVAGSEEFEAIRALLARHIGPIAKIMVQKAATEARSLDEFCERLAAHVGTPAERATFLQATRARLAQRR
jgi:TIR domain